MRFFIDAQLPPLLCQFFTQRGHEARHVFESFEHSAPDEIIFDHGRESLSVIVTKDDYFARQSDAKGAPPQILWLRIGNCRNPALIETLSSAWLNIEAALERGERIVELRG